MSKSCQNGQKKCQKIVKSCQKVVANFEVEDETCGRRRRRRK
jgi:hypothetical protein